MSKNQNALKREGFRDGPMVMQGEIAVTIQRAHDFDFVNPNDPNKGDFKTLGQKIDEILAEAGRDGYVKEFTIKMPPADDS